MTKEQFEDEYIKKSDLTKELYNEYFVTLPCNCHAEECQGWACVDNNPLSIKTHKELYQ